MSETPTSTAWFAHRVAGQRHLGVFDPDTKSCFDLGAICELTALADGRLRDPGDLLSRCATTATPLATPLAAPPAFDVPVARPSKILCLGKNFAAHAAEFGAAVPEQPIFFTKFADTMIPHGQPIVLPHWVETRIDHELELAVILGFDDRAGHGRKYVPAETAMELVAGYTILNDVTARQIQGDDREQHRPWLRSKSFDTFCPIGPWVVPASGVAATSTGPDREAGLQMRLHVNGELRQASSTDLMVIDVPHAIEYLSRHTTLRPGDIIAMGTPAGVGPIDQDDTVTCWIESLGTLRNPVVRETGPT